MSAGEETKRTCTDLNSYPQVFLQNSSQPQLHLELSPCYQAPPPCMVAVFCYCVVQLIVGKFLGRGGGDPSAFCRWSKT